MASEGDTSKNVPTTTEAPPTELENVPLVSVPVPAGVQVEAAVAVAAASVVTAAAPQDQTSTTTTTTGSTLLVQVPYPNPGMDLSSVNVHVEEEHHQPTLESDQVAQIANLTAPNLEEGTEAALTSPPPQARPEGNEDATAPTENASASAASQEVVGVAPSEQHTWHGFFMQLQAHAAKFKTLSIEAGTNPPLEAWVAQQRAYYMQQKAHDEQQLQQQQAAAEGEDEQPSPVQEPQSAQAETEESVPKEGGDATVVPPPTTTSTSTTPPSVQITPLSHERQTLLNALGFQWDESQTPHTLRATGGHYTPDEDAKWKAAFQLLVEYKTVHGHPNVAETYKVDAALGKWVAQQRAMYRKETLPLDRLNLLRDLGFDFTPGDKKIPFQTRLDQLKKYKEVHGDTRVPRRWTENPGLGEWLHSQKKMYRKWENGQKGAMTDERRKVLLDHGVDFSIMEPGPRSLFASPLVDPSTPTMAGVVLGVSAEGESGGVMPDGAIIMEDLVPANRVSKWDEKFHQLKHYKTVHGHTNVPRRSKRNPQHDALGEWVHFQRRQYRNLHTGKTSTMTTARKKALELLGFQWSRSGLSRRMRNYPVPTVDIDADLSWDERYLQLETFYKAYGHSNVQENWIENPSLTLWCNQQRELYHAWRSGAPSEMTQERFGRLQTLGFDFDAKVQLESVTTAVADQEGESLNVVEVQMMSPSLGDEGQQGDTEAEESTMPKIEAEGDTEGDDKSDVDMPPITPETTVEETAKASGPPKEEESHPIIEDEEDLIEIVVGDDITQQEGVVEEANTMTVDSGPAHVTPTAHEIDESDVQAILDGKNQSESTEVPQDLAPISTWEDGYNQLTLFVKGHGHCQVPDTWAALSVWTKKQRVVFQQWRNGIAVEDSEMNDDKFVRLANLGFSFDEVNEKTPNVTNGDNNQNTEGSLLDTPQHLMPSIQKDQGTEVLNDTSKETESKEETKEIETSSATKAECKGDSTEENEKVAQPSETEVNSEVVEATGEDNVASDMTTQVSPESSRPVKKRKTMLVRVEWDERYLELVQYKLRKGNCNVPPKWKPNPGLADWVRKQRYHYNLLYQKNEPSVLSKARVDKLNSLGFQFLIFNPDGSIMSEDEVISDVSGKSNGKKVPVKKRAMKATPKSRFKEGKWLESLSKVVAYKEEHGSCNVPRKWKQDPTLGEWVHFQRRQFRLKQLGRRNHMTEERIQKLEAVGFEWSRGSPNPPTYMRLYEDNKGAGNMAEQFIDQSATTEEGTKIEGGFMDTNVPTDQMHQVPVQTQEISAEVEPEPIQMENVISELTQEHGTEAEGSIQIQTDEVTKDEELIEV